MMVELGTLSSQRELADLISRLRRLDELSKAILRDFANDLRDKEIARHLGTDESGMCFQRDLISQEMGERRSTDGICKAVALSVRGGLVTPLITPENLSNLSLASLDNDEMRFWGLMGLGLSSYDIAGKTGLRFDLVDNRRKRIASDVGAKTIYRAAALAAYVIKQTQDGLGLHRAGI